MTGLLASFLLSTKLQEMRKCRRNVNDCLKMPCRELVATKLCIVFYSNFPGNCPSSGRQFEVGIGHCLKEPNEPMKWSLESDTIIMLHYAPGWTRGLKQEAFFRSIIFKYIAGDDLEEKY